MAQTTSAVQHYLPQRIWNFNLFLLIFLIWWAIWEFRTVDWTFPQYAYLLFAPTLLFFVCSLLTPLNLEGEGANIEAHFKRVQRPFFATYFLAVVAIVVDGNLLSDEPLWHNGRYGHVLLLAAPVWGYFSSSRKGQIAVAVVTLLALVITLVARFWVPR